MTNYQLHHIGIVVRDLDRAMADLSDAADATWSTAVDTSAWTVWTPDGTRNLRFRSLYSADGPVYVQLIEAVEGTIWETKSDGDLHHLGYLSDDVEATIARLQRDGFTRVASGSKGEGPTLWTYHQRGSGPYIEYASTSLRPDRVDSQDEE